MRADHPDGKNYSEDGPRRAKCIPHANGKPSSWVNVRQVDVSLGVNRQDSHGLEVAL